MNIRKVSRGFTLIELLVVISIIGILIGLTVVAFQSAKASARDAKRKTDLETIRSALDIYRTDCGDYPATLPAPGSPLIGDGTPASCATGNIYISAVPGDPLYTAGYLYSYPPPPGSSYVLCASLETQTTGGAPGGCGSCGTAACNYKVESP
ncbi:MAG: prepilin-type N-terminal cleavage/methylation domain-containing protein [Candidatus Blackburnbacteria bacterium]|nr:prepilin-type N-terminal cleavage/methylation domain-containing protein [Candidatus Blackburnbacteria bacterium]